MRFLFDQMAKTLFRTQRRKNSGNLNEKLFTIIYYTLLLEKNF